LGREAPEFDTYHSLAVLESYPELRVGRLVPEVSSDELQKYHVEVHEWIYDFADLRPGKSGDKNHHRIYEHVSKLGGMNASDAIEKTDETAMALVQLVLGEQQRIVGKAVKPGERLKEIPEGEVRKHTDPRDVAGAWTVVDGLVYEVSGKYAVAYSEGRFLHGAFMNADGYFFHHSHHELRRRLLFIPYS
jgi:hypothetical protein